MAYPFDAIMPVGTAGLTLTASVVSKTGAALGSQPASTIVDLGGGFYLYTTDAMPDGHRGAVKLLQAGTPVAAVSVNPRETENADIKLSAATIAAAEVVITPMQAVTTNPRYATRNVAPIAQGSQPTDIWNIVDANGAPLSLLGKTVRLVAYTTEDPDVDEPYDEIQTGAFQYETGGGGITVSGANNNQVSLLHDSAKTAVAGDYRYWLWNVTDKLPLAKGKLPIEPALIAV